MTVILKRKRKPFSLHVYVVRTLSKVERTFVTGIATMSITTILIVITVSDRKDIHESVVVFESP